MIFLSLTLNAVTLLLCKKKNFLSHSFQNFYSNQTNKLLRVFFIGDQDLQLREGLGTALPTHAQNFEFHPSMGFIPQQKNKSSPFSSCFISNSIQTNFSRLLNLGHTYSFIIMAYLKMELNLQYKKVSSRIMSLSSSPCIPQLTEDVLPRFILLFVPSMYGLPFPCAFTLTLP